MHGNYMKWLENEKKWIDEIERKAKRDRNLYSPLVVIVCVVAFGALGLFASGSIDVNGMLHNMLFGLIFGIVCVLFVWLMMLSYYPAKRYMKSLKTQIEDVLTPEEREEFASQMLGAEGEVKDISWTTGKWYEGITKWRVQITRDYALETCGRGWAQLVQLRKVANTAVDERENITISWGAGFKIRMTSKVYLILFYYQKYANGEKGKNDKEFIFERREIREEVSHYLHEMKIGE